MSQLRQSLIQRKVVWFQQDEALADNFTPDHGINK